MKRTFLFIICLTIGLISASYSQRTVRTAGLSLDSYELPTNRTGFTNFSSANYYQPVFSEQKSVPKLVLNQQKLKKDKVISLFVNSLLLLNASNQSNNFGSIGLPSPAFNPLINSLNGPNDYLLLQQHEFQKNNVLPMFIAAPKALQIRF